MSRAGERALAHRGGAHDGGAGRSLLPLLPEPARGDHARHRRHLRRGARPTAAVAVQRPLRHSLFSCPSTSIMSRAASRWRFSCARARRRRASRSAPSSSTWCAASAGTGRAPGSPSGETATTAGPRPWRGARRTAVDYIFGLAGNPVLHRFAYGVADDLKVRRAEAGAEKMRSFAAFDYAAGSWNRERRVVARLEASARGFDARYIVTSLRRRCPPSL